MGIRSCIACVATAAVLVACGEQQGSDRVTGPSLGHHPSPPAPTDPALCNPGTLDGQITAYFPGSLSRPIKTLKDQMLAASAGSNTRLNAGFQILQEIGKLSRAQAVDTVAGSNLAQGIIRCIYDAKAFSPAFPTDPSYNFAPALSANKGGAFYTRGSGTGDETPVQGAVDIFTTPNILSGVKPLGTWATALAGNPSGKALIYGYRVSGYPFNNDPFVYEWATIPPATQFSGGAVVALCDDANPSTAMVHESNIGVLAYESAAPICDAGYSLVIKEGWGPRALAARLARVVVDAVQPPPLQAATLGKSGTGGTATTFKSKFQKNTVQAVGLAYVQAPPAVMNIKKMPYPVRVFVSADVGDAANGVNGVCVYLSGRINNGTPTALTGPQECPNTPDKGVSVVTKSITIGGQLRAGYADLLLGVTKPGQLIITATGTDAAGNSGVIGREGQTFQPAVVRVNVKP